MRVVTLLRHLDGFDGDNETAMVLVRDPKTGEDRPVKRLVRDPVSQNVVLYVAPVRDG